MAKYDKKSTKSSRSSKLAPLPAFDEQALSSLTEKIDQGLHNSKLPERTLQNEQSKSKDSKKYQDSVNGHTTAKKRDAKGNIKEPAPSNSRKLKAKGLGTDRELLLQEILALGGTEEDLGLVEDVVSEDNDEEESNPPTKADSKFLKELSKFVAGLGIEGQVNADQSASELDEAEYEVGGENYEQDDDGEWEDEALQSPVAIAQVAPIHDDQKKARKDKEPTNRLMFEARPDWHAAPLPELPEPDLSESGPYRSTIAELKKYSLTLLHADTELYSSAKMAATSSQRFIAQIMTSGTLSDKVSALTLVVQESPVHTTKSLENLLGLAKKRSRGQAVTALGAIKDLLGQGVVLPSDRRLKTFITQPGLLGTLQTDPASEWKIGDPLPGKITAAHLISWAYEDWLKEMYFEMLKVLEVWCNDEIEYARSRAVTYVFELLRDKPEQESNLLRLLVIKLGDPDKKIASRTSYLILQLQTTHPLMKPIIVQAIESELVLRPGQSSHAKYYAINTLNQTILSGKEEVVARKLLSIYFELFVVLLKKPEPPKPVVGPVLNRKGQVQGGGGQMGKKAKEKVTLAEAAKLASEETTEKMISAVLTGVNRAFPFAKSDDSTLEKHMDMLFRITHSSNFNTSIQALMLIEQLATSKQLAVERFYRTLYESLLDHRLITSSKHALYLNVLFRALKADVNLKRVKGFVKRLLQIITLHQPPFICGVLYLIRELEATFPGLGSLITDPEELDEDEEEVFKDVPDEESSNLVYETTPWKDSITHPDRKATLNPKPDLYDGRKRDPEHSNADKSCLWELLPFLLHFHPSVSMFAARLLSQNEMPPKPDLASHSLIAFLDKFVYKNAKATSAGLRGSSIMQPLAGGDSKGVLVSNRLASNTHQPLNTEAFWRKKAEDVAVDEVFFHKYFNQVSKPKKTGKDKKADNQAKYADTEDDEDAGEDEIWDALVESRPEIEGDSGDDSDLEMIDLDDDSDQSSIESGVVIEGSDEEESKLGSEEDEVSNASAMELDSDVDLAESDLDELFEKELQAEKPDEAKTEKDAKREERKSKRRKMKSLPTFASVEDYAQMLDNDEDEDF